MKSSANTNPTYIAIDQEIIERVTLALERTEKALERAFAREQALITQVGTSQLMNEAEAAAYLNRDPATLRFYRKNGMPFIKKGRAVWYTKGDIDAWLATGKVVRRDVS